MRNLKRVLSLALALMMALSLMAFTGSASAAESTTIPVASDLYSDYDQTNYPEAIDVVTALRIVEGTDGELLPSGTLTRAEATTIAARMLLGVDAAETLPNVNTYTGYKDVDSVDHWAAAYIAFCDNQGIVSGVGGGNFNPNGQLTGVAFGKVILTVLGYDADKEGLKGDSWATNVTIALTNAGINVTDSEGNPINLAEPITREQAMEMTFQALQTPLVEYPTMTISQSAIATKNGASYVTSTTANASNISDKGVTGNTISSNSTLVEFGEKYFQKLKLNETVDAFGRPTHTWVLNNITIDSYDDSDRLLVAEYDSEVNDVTVAGDLAGYYMPVGNATEGNTTGKDNVPVNDYTKYPYDTGKLDSDGDPIANTTYKKILYQNSTSPETLQLGYKDEKSVKHESTLAETIARLTGNGKKVEIYVDKTYENIVNNIVVIDYVAGTLNVVRPVTNDRTNYAVTNAKWDKTDATHPNVKAMVGTTLTGSEFDNENVKDTVVYYDGAKSGDVVTCAMIDDVLYIYPTTTVENGVQSSKTAELNTRETVKVVISGETYTLGTSVNNVDESDFPNSKNSTTYYLDQYGYIVSSGKANLSYAYVVAVGGGVTPSPEGNKPVVKVRAVLADGSADEYNLAVERDTNGKWYIKNNKAAGEIVVTSDETARTSVAKKLATVGESDTFTVWDYSIDETTDTITLYKLNTIEDDGPVSTNSKDKGTVYIGTAVSGNDGKISNGTTSVKVEPNGSHTIGERNLPLYLNYETTFVIYNSKTLTATVKTGNTSLSSYSDGLTDAKLVAIANGGDTVVSYLVFATYDKVETTTVNTNYVYIDVDKKTTSSNGTVTFTAYKSDGTAIEVTDEAGVSGATAKIVDVTGIYEYDTATGQVTAQVATAKKGGDSYLQGGRVTEIANGLIEMNNSSIYGKAINTGSENAVYVDVEKGHENGAYAFIVMGKNNTIETVFIVPVPDGAPADNANIYKVAVAKKTDTPAGVEVSGSGTGKYSASVIMTTGISGQEFTVTVTCDDPNSNKAADKVTVAVTNADPKTGENEVLTTTAETAKGDVVGTVTYVIRGTGEATVSLSVATNKVDPNDPDVDINDLLEEASQTVEGILPTSVEIPNGRTLTLSGDSTIPSSFNQSGSGKLAIAGDATVSIAGKATVSDIEAGANVTVTGTLVIDGSVGAGATISTADLTKVTLGEGADISDGSIKSAVKLSTAISTSTITTVGIGVPIYAATSSDTGSNDWNIQPCTVAVKWKTTANTTVKQTISDGQRTYTVTGEKAGANGNITMFDLKNPYYEPGEGMDGEWSGTGTYTSFEDASAGNTLTIKVTTVDGTPIVDFSMANPFKTP